MPSLDEVLEFRREMFERSMALVEAKGHDYNADQQRNGDTLFNLRVAAILGATDSPERGVLVRLCDKLMRLISLMKDDREPRVIDESLWDTVADVHNYADYALILHRESRVEVARRAGPQDQRVASLVQDIERLKPLAVRCDTHEAMDSAECPHCLRERIVHLEAQAKESGPPPNPGAEAEGFLRWRRTSPGDMYPIA